MHAEDVVRNPVRGGDEGDIELGGAKSTEEVQQPGRAQEVLDARRRQRQEVDARRDERENPIRSHARQLREERRRKRQEEQAQSEDDENIPRSRAREMLEARRRQRAEGPALSDAENPPRSRTRELLEIRRRQRESEQKRREEENPIRSRSQDLLESKWRRSDPNASHGGENSDSARKVVDEALEATRSQRENEQERRDDEKDQSIRSRGRELLETRRRRGEEGLVRRDGDEEDPVERRVREIVEARRQREGDLVQRDGDEENPVERRVRDMLEARRLRRRREEEGDSSEAAIIPRPAREEHPVRHRARELLQERLRESKEARELEATKRTVESPFTGEVEKARDPGPDRERQKIGAIECVGATAATTVVCVVIAFQVLCVGDQQCLATGDPAVLDGSRLVIITMLAASAAIGLPLLAAATRGDRRVARGGLVFSAAMAALVVALAVERGGFRLVHGRFGRMARRQWRRCENDASPTGVWRRRGGCRYSNNVKVFYKTHHNLAEQTRRNLEHVLYALIALAANFALATLACASVLLASSGTEAWIECGDCLRLRPRLGRPPPPLDEEDPDREEEEDQKSTT